MMRKKRKGRGRKRLLPAVILLAVVIPAAAWMFSARDHIFIHADASMPEMDVQLLDVSPYTRPGMDNEGIRGVVIHYTANPGASAQDNRDYFNGLADGHGARASCHFIVGLDGEIIQCVPTWEYAYASNSRNGDTISIECCHRSPSGKFTRRTYRSAVQLTAWLCAKYGLTEDQVIRHYDITGKDCPKYFVEHEGAWKTFRENVGRALERSEQKE